MKKVVINESLLRFVLIYLLPLYPRSWVIQASCRTMETTGKKVKASHKVA